MSKSAKARNVRRRPSKKQPPKSPLGAEAHAYSQADLRRLFRLSAGLIRALASAGLISAALRAGKTEYSFQDLLVLRMAAALQAAQVPAARVIAAFATIRAAVPPGTAVTSLALSACNGQVNVGEGGRSWDASSRQFSLPWLDQPSVQRATVPATPTRKEEAEALYLSAQALEEFDIAAARAAYVRALSLFSEHQEARINLGRLLHLAGELDQAETVYRQAKRSSALLSFNLATLLEDLHREQEAIAGYRQALAQDPSMHDAHFNLSRLYERANQPRDALRHLLAYRRQVGQSQD